MGNLEGLSETGLLGEIGNRIKQERLNQNITQEELARSAGMARNVVSRLENGFGATLKSFLRILRVLKKIEQLNLFLPESSFSPIDLVKREGKKRKEASGGRGRALTREDGHGQ